MWDLIVSVPDHCLSFYFPLQNIYIKSKTLNLIGCYNNQKDKLAKTWQRKS